MAPRERSPGTQWVSREWGGVDKVPRMQRRRVTCFSKMLREQDSKGTAVRMPRHEAGSTANPGETFAWWGGGGGGARSLLKLAGSKLCEQLGPCCILTGAALHTAVCSSRTPKGQRSSGVFISKVAIRPTRSAGLLVSWLRNEQNASSLTVRCPSATRGIFSFQRHSVL